jgi:hypothetical protein
MKMMRKMRVNRNTIIEIYSKKKIQINLSIQIIVGGLKGVRKF